MQKIVGKILKANREFGLIKKGDKIAVGVSGGKDSLILLEGLARIQKFLDLDIEIIAITIDLGFEKEEDHKTARGICEKYDILYIVERTEIFNIVFNEKKQEKNPCSLCSKLKKGVLNTIAKENGCNKVAFGHHLDDVVETFLMNLFIEGRIGCFSPVTFFSRQDLFLVRPLIFVEERQIKKTLKNLNFTVSKSLCPKDGDTYRETMKKFLMEKEKSDKGFKKRIFGAIRRGNIAGFGFKN